MPILIPSQESYAFHRTDWGAFGDDEELDMTQRPDVSEGTPEDIDDALEDWTQTVKRVTDRHIPKTTFRLAPYTAPSRDTQLIRIQFQSLKDRARL